MSGDKIAPGPPATRAHLLAAQERDRLLRTELPRVRAAATAWRNALAALLTALIGFSLVKGRSDVNQLATPWAVAVGALLLTALVCGAIGALSLVRAAHGRPSVSALRDLLSRRVADHTEASAAAKALRRGITLTLACTAFLVTAVAVTWYGPAASPPALQVTTPTTGTICGTVVRTDRGTLVLKTRSGEVLANLTEATAIKPVDACPAA
jgi:hypothetical protein